MRPSWLRARPPGPSTARAGGAAVVALAGCLATAGCGATAATPGGTGATGGPDATVVPVNALVERVVDGDTVVLDIDGRRETVRLIGIDTPETVKPDSPVECFGPEASAAAHDLLPEGTPVLIERDVEARDDYGRLLGYVTRASDGVFVNLELVRQGFAKVATFPPNVAHVDEFVAAAVAAREEGAGLWSGCTG